jgi:hypothetical protein
MRSPSTPPSFTRNFLLLLAGPIIWAAHFLTIYGFTGVMCARPAWRQAWLGISLISWGVGGASVIALIAIAAIHSGAGRASLRRQDAGFVRWTGAMLGMLSAVAIVWEAASLFLLPQC